MEGAMPRKPNYQADRIERERAKAAKRAKRDEARSERSARNKPARDSEGEGEAAPAEEK